MAKAGYIVSSLRDIEGIIMTFPIDRNYSSVLLYAWEQQEFRISSNYERVAEKKL